jgi:glucosamine-6-phosphate deaminase
VAKGTADNPAGICGPIGPTEQLPLVARLVNELSLSLKHAHFWGMDEWVNRGREVPPSHPLSFEKADRELCFNRISSELAYGSKSHFPKANTASYRKSWDGVRCVVMQGGQGDIKHWAFNDPPKREADTRNAPPSAGIRALQTRMVDLHPITIAQNARTSGGGNITLVPPGGWTVGQSRHGKAEKVSIWHAGKHDNAFGQRLTTLMISKRVADSSVPMSLLADHPNVQFNFYRGGIGTCEVEMH